MAQSPPLWKQVFDNLERVVGPRLDGLARTEEFAILTALSQRGIGEIDRRLQNTSRRLWHRLNLPAGSDIDRLLEHVARLERHVSELEHQFKDRENAEYLASLNSRFEARNGGAPLADTPTSNALNPASRSARAASPTRAKSNRRAPSKPADRTINSAT